MGIIVNPFTPIAESFKKLSPAEQFHTVGLGAVSAAGALNGASSVWSAQRQRHHEKMSRLHMHHKALNSKELTVRQFIQERACGGANPRQIETSLTAWGGKCEGISLADPANFSVVKTGKTGFGEPPNYSLHLVHKDRRSGLRGGATEKDLLLATSVDGSHIDATELVLCAEQAAPTGDIEQWSLTNPICEVAERGDRDHMWQAFTVPMEPTPFQETLVGSFAISFFCVAVAGGLFTWGALLFQRSTKADKPAPSQDQVTELNGTIDGTIKGTKQLSATLGSSDSRIAAATASTALLSVLTASHDRKITKAVALSLLKDYHNKTEEEALALLEERRFLPSWPGVHEVNPP